MEKKEFYQHYLPHFQQPGQAYFVTWCLKDAVPPKALHTYTQNLEILHSQIGLLEKDQEGNPIYLQDLLQSVKRFSANQINKLENRQGNLWQKESFDTTIRNEEHLHNAINFTLNNPVTAGLIPDWKLWPGSWYGSGDL